MKISSVSVYHIKGGCIFYCNLRTEDGVIPVSMGFDALLDFSYKVIVELPQTALTKTEIQKLENDLCLVEVTIY